MIHSSQTETIYDIIVYLHKPLTINRNTDSFKEQLLLDQNRPIDNDESIVDIILDLKETYTPNQPTTSKEQHHVYFPRTINRNTNLPKEKTSIPQNYSLRVCCEKCTLRRNQLQLSTKSQVLEDKLTIQEAINPIKRPNNSNDIHSQKRPKLNNSILPCFRQNPQNSNAAYSQQYTNIPVRISPELKISSQQVLENNMPNLEIKLNPSVSNLQQSRLDQHLRITPPQIQGYFSPEQNRDNNSLRPCCELHPNRYIQQNQKRRGYKSFPAPQIELNRKVGAPYLRDVAAEQVSKNSRQQTYPFLDLINPSDWRNGSPVPGEGRFVQTLKSFVGETNSESEGTFKIPASQIDQRNNLQFLSTSNRSGMFTGTMDSLVPEPMVSQQGLPNVRSNTELANLKGCINPIQSNLYSETNTPFNTPDLEYTNQFTALQAKAVEPNLTWVTNSYPTNINLPDSRIRGPYDCHF